MTLFFEKLRSNATQASRESAGAHLRAVYRYKES